MIANAGESGEKGPSLNVGGMYTGTVAKDQ